MAIAYAPPIFLLVNENNREINPSHQMSNEFFTGGSCSIKVEKNASAKALFEGSNSSYSNRLGLFGSKTQKNPIAIAILNEGKGRVALVGDSGWLMFPSWQIRKNIDNERIAINLVDWLSGNITDNGEN